VSFGRVLIADDEPAVLKAYARFLTDAGFEVVRAFDGRDALRRIKSGPIDAVLSDVGMPKVDGFALLHQLRLRSPDLPVVLMLDKPDNRAAIKATELGAVECLVKPVTASLLAEAASYAVRLARSRRSVPAPLNSAGDLAEAPSVSATEAKNEFGQILEKAIRGVTVVIKKHDAPKAVLISIDRVNRLAHAPQAQLEALTGRFDRLLAKMQTPASRTAMKSAFRASPRQLGRAARAAARKRA
jgi:antitoxin Phd